MPGTRLLPAIAALVVLLATPVPAQPLCAAGLLVLVPDLRMQGIVAGEAQGLCRIEVESGASVLRHPALLRAAEAGDTPPDTPEAPDQNTGG